MYLYVQGVKWVEQISINSFISIVMVSALLSLFLTRSYLRTFLSDIDLTFLLPAEPYLSRYFKYSFYYSFAIQLLQSILLMLFLYPFFRKEVWDIPLFMTVLFIVIVLEGLNLLFHMQKRQVLNYYYRICQFVVNFLLFVLLLYNPIFSLPFISVLSYYFILHSTWYIPSYAWSLFIKDEKKRKNTYYTVASFFIDIPIIQQRIYNRKLPLFLLKNLKVSNHITDLSNH